MVIFGGLELVAAGYLLHEHAKHKEERARLEEEEAAAERRRRRRRHSADRRRRHSRDRKQSYSYEYEDARPPRDSRPQYLAPTTYPAASPYLAPTAQPARANSAPPSQQQQQQDPNYPPTGWPQHWPQSQRPEPNVGPREAGPLPSKYGWRPDQEHVDSDAYENQNPQYSPAPASRRRSRGRSETRPADGPAQSAARPAANGQRPVASPHVHFALPDDRNDPPPAYSR